MSHEPPRSVRDADLALPRPGEEPVSLVDRKAGDERATSARVAGDDLTGRERRTVRRGIATQLAGSAHRPQRVALVCARDAEDREQTLVSQPHALASVSSDDPVGALRAPLKLPATRLGVTYTRLRGKVGDEHGHHPSRLHEVSRLHGRRRQAGDGRAQLWVVTQDRPLQLLQLRARLGPELLDECPASRGVRVQRVGLPTRPVQREHEVPAQPLAERVLGDQRLELCDELAVPPEREIGVDPILDGREPALVEVSGVRVHRLAGEVGECRAAPEREGIVQQRGSPCGICVPRLADESRESLEVQLIRAHAQEVAVAMRDETIAELPTQASGVVAERCTDCSGRLVTPDGLYERVERHGPVRVEQEPRKHGAPLGTAERQHTLAVARLERPQDAELHGRNALRSPCSAEASSRPGRPAIRAVSLQSSGCARAWARTSGSSLATSTQARSRRARTLGPPMELS